MPPCSRPRCPGRFPVQSLLSRAGVCKHSVIRLLSLLGVRWKRSELHKEAFCSHTASRPEPTRWTALSRLGEGMLDTDYIGRKYRGLWRPSVLVRAHSFRLKIGQNVRLLCCFKNLFHETPPKIPRYFQLLKCHCLHRSFLNGFVISVMFYFVFHCFIIHTVWLHCVSFLACEVVFWILIFISLWIL